MKTLDEASVEGKTTPLLAGRDRQEGAGSSRRGPVWALLARGDQLEFPNVFVPENERTFVHLAQAV